jgi:hypothetical protein
MDSGRRSGLDRFDPHVFALSLLFRMSELRQRVALICELSVFTQLLFSVALGPQMESARSRVVRPKSFSSSP